MTRTLNRSFEELLAWAESDEPKLLDCALRDLHSHNLAEEGVSLAFLPVDLTIDECFVVIGRLGDKYPEIASKYDYPSV